jgi:hypothetical protein
MRVLISAVTPHVMAADGRPDGLPKTVFDDFQARPTSKRPGPGFRMKADQ